MRQPLSRRAAGAGSARLIWKPLQHDDGLIVLWHASSTKLH